MDDLLQATDDKHLIFEDRFEGEADAAHPPSHSKRRQYDFWGNRYLCIQGIYDRKFWQFDIFDLFTSESKSMRFQKSFSQFRRVETYFLDYKFMLIVEDAGWHNLHCVTLVKLNWESGIFEALKHFERNYSFLDVIVDPLNQSKFVLVIDILHNLIEYQECKLVNDKVKFGSVHQLFNIYDQCLSDKLIEVTRLDQKFCVDTYNMIDKQEQFFETEACPEHVELADNSLSNWIIDRVYAAIWFQDSDRYGLMWADAQTRRWNIVDFSTNIEIRNLHFFDGSLIIRTQQEKTENGIFESNLKFYGIDIGRPQSLRQKSWLRVVCNLKLKGNSDPYKEAARYLPLNTDLRPHWFEDVEEEAPEKQKEAKSDQGKDEKSNFDGTTGKSETIQGATLDQGGDKDSKKDTDEKTVQAKFADLSI